MSAHQILQDYRDKKRDPVGAFELLRAAVKHGLNQSGRPWNDSILEEEVLAEVDKLKPNPEEYMNVLTDSGIFDIWCASIKQDSGKSVLSNEEILSFARGIERALNAPVFALVEENARLLAALDEARLALAATHQAGGRRKTDPQFSMTPAMVDLADRLIELTGETV